MNKSKLALDEIDHAIVLMLQEDGRRAYTSIAEDLNLAPSTVQQRANRLLDAGLLTIKGIVHPADLAEQVVAMIAIKANGSQLNSVAAKIGTLAEVRWVVICVGSYDILAEVVCQDNQHLLSLLSDKLSSIKGVRETVTFLYLDILKRAHEWRLPD